VYFIVSLLVNLKALTLKLTSATGSPNLSTRSPGSLAYGPKYRLNGQWPRGSGSEASVQRRLRVVFGREPGTKRDLQAVGILWSLSGFVCPDMQPVLSRARHDWHSVPRQWGNPCGQLLKRGALMICKGQVCRLASPHCLTLPCCG
jgi:hypothetical protein